MTTIEEFPDNPKYTIKSVAAQTGIRPVTLRAWERRHEVLTPHRSENRYRLYSDRDVAILRWLKKRVDDGISISNASYELRAMLKRNLWPEATPSLFPLERVKVGGQPQHYARQLYEAFIQHDEGHVGDLIRQANAIFDLKTLCMDVLSPCLVAIGEAWYNGEIRITTEHFASAYIRGRLSSLMQTFSIRRTSPHILIGCAPDEQHEIGSLMIAVLLRAQGYRVEFLGQDIPLNDLVDYARDERPNMIILAATMPDSAVMLTQKPEFLSRLRRPPLFGYGGSAFNHDPELRERVGGVFLGEMLDAAVDRVKHLLDSSP